ncbi:hypothetical protein Q604_UNBC15685G0001, partial [human gut metagenome]
MGGVVLGARAAPAPARAPRRLRLRLTGDLHGRQRGMGRARMARMALIRRRRSEE